MSCVQNNFIGKASVDLPGGDHLSLVDTEGTILGNIGNLVLKQSKEPAEIGVLPSTCRYKMNSFLLQGGDKFKISGDSTWAPFCRSVPSRSLAIRRIITNPPVLSEILNRNSL